MDAVAQMKSVQTKTTIELRMACESSGLVLEVEAREDGGTHEAHYDAESDPGMHGVVAFPLAVMLAFERTDVAVPAAGGELAPCEGRSSGGPTPMPGARSARYRTRRGSRATSCAALSISSRTISREPKRTA